MALVSFSGGKDSTATLLLALERLPKANVFPAFADTGNEHPAVYEYLLYIEKKLGIRIKRLHADFTDRWWARRDYVRDHWSAKGVHDDIIRRVLQLLEKGPTGNPFLDLCVIKGRFPSRMAQFCTQELKKFPLIDYTMWLVERHRNIESWQGVRADESAVRAKLVEREINGEPFTIYRPILKWTAAEVFAFHRKHGVEPNPLYKMGMNRVGCMPCINVSKGELLTISRRFPEHIARIAEWERILGEASKRGASSFFTEREGEPTGGIGVKVDWAKTLHGGQQYDLLASGEELSGCASSYGLCDLPEDSE